MLDFGLTTDLESLIRENPADRQIVGTAAHMSPEQSAGREASAASDWYSVAIDSTNTLIAFSVPSVVVPDTFTFTGAITNASGVLGYVPASGATTGTFNQAWLGGPGSWSTLPSNFEIEARVFAQAVPEPSSVALLSVGAFGLIAYGRRRKGAEAV